MWRGAHKIHENEFRRCLYTEGGGPREKVNGRVDTQCTCPETCHSDTHEHLLAPLAPHPTTKLAIPGNTGRACHGHETLDCGRLCIHEGADTDPLLRDTKDCAPDRTSNVHLNQATSPMPCSVPAAAPPFGNSSRHLLRQRAVELPAPRERTRTPRAPHPVACLIRSTPPST